MVGGNAAAAWMMMVGVASGFELLSGHVVGHHREVARWLAPREVLVEEFGRLGASEVDLSATAKSRYIAELLADGDLEQEELASMFAEVASGGSLDVEGFVELCARIDDLFEDEEEDEAADDEADEAADEIEEEPSADADALRAALSEALDKREATIRPEYDGDDAIVTAALALAEATDVTDADVLGTWDLAYASSQSFTFNDGYTGVGSTTPGGAKFESLVQTLEDRASSAKAATMVETLTTAVGDLVVTVLGDWDVVDRPEPISRRPQTLLEIRPRSVEYGLVKVDGNRVEKGWKTMRVLNSMELVYLDELFRIQRGAGGACFVWVKRPE